MSSSPNITSLNLPELASLRRVGWLRSAPNLLTMMRLCLVPALLLAAAEKHFSLALILFVIAAITDLLDGLLARWLSQRTLVGEYLDPLADKILLGGIFLVLTRQGAIEPYIAVMVFGRDLGMALVALILYATIRLSDYRPTLLGKANSLSQVFTVGFVLLSLVTRDSTVLRAQTFFLDSTVALTVSSGFHYAWIVSRRIGSAFGEG